MYEERGVIKNKGRGKQINNFVGLKRQRNITPTDIDGFIDYAGNAFIYFEGKVSGNELPYGQKLALQAAVKSHWKAGNPCIAIIYEHDVPEHLEIMVHECTVKNLYCLNHKGYSWEDGSGKTVLYWIEYFEERYQVWNYG
jgi:hypothetical protein